MYSKFAAPILFAIFSIGVQAQDFHDMVVALSPVDNGSADQSPGSTIVERGEAGQGLMRRLQQTQDRAQSERERELERELVRELERERQRDRRIEQARQERELEQLRRAVAAAREAQARGQQQERGRAAEQVQATAVR
jgi:membrane protein involved in colicin uptake